MPYPYQSEDITSADQLLSVATRETEIRKAPGNSGDLSFSLINLLERILAIIHSE
jgi:hypothetical protein